IILSAAVAFPFCRYVCPYGVLLGLFSLAAFRRRKLPENCRACGACERSCPVGAIRTDRERRTAEADACRCIQCGICRDACRSL
ncbi:MAG: 4Fe-4S binding protein, partial [Planctomycetota bacterium]|nr:4Fe-4S binding protein [Planctomycetota bacterium]